MRTAVIDLGFGDSGKGTVTAFLCNSYPNPIVVRFSGGHQAGHTVVHNGIRHVFSSFGSGTLQGIPTYWSKDCTFYPKAFLNEWDVLREKGVKPKIYVDANCPVTTPYDIHHNKRMEKENNHGSCGVGFGATLEREENYYSLTVSDLLYPSVRDMKIDQIQKYYRYGDTHEMMNDFKAYCDEVIDYIHIVKDDSILDQFTTMIEEGSQGLLLDKDIGFFPHVTRANVGTKNINPEIVFYVTRAYQTRHGNGPMTNEHIEHNIKVNPNETNVPNYQGNFRRTLLDVDLLRYAMYKDNFKGIKRLVITCMDHIQDDLRFTYNGKVVQCTNDKSFIKAIQKILDIEIVYASYSDEFKNIERYG